MTGTLFSLRVSSILAHAARRRQRCLFRGGFLGQDWLKLVLLRPPRLEGEKKKRQHHDENPRR